MQDNDSSNAIGHTWNLVGHEGADSAGETYWCLSGPGVYVSAEDGKVCDFEVSFDGAERLWRDASAAREATALRAERDQLKESFARDYEAMDDLRAERDFYARNMTDTEVELATRAERAEADAKLQHDRWLILSGRLIDAEAERDELGRRFINAARKRSAAEALLALQQPVIDAANEYLDAKDRAAKYRTGRPAAKYEGRLIRALDTLREATTSTDQE